MNNTEIFEQIRKFADMNKLTFFVGAGVSKLSGFPSWYELVKSMGDEINYYYKTTYDIDGNEIINLSPYEFLKIPQMYYVQFGSDLYNQKVKDSFVNECEPNEIHNLIISLHPNHILTTNYDTLIEDVATKFGENYSVIASDKDISEAETTRYLLKVHGDFSADFVLKESDYLNYEFNYQLISNLMKSIFATNLVIFIGYSLDDYNIKLILNWMQNVQKDAFVKPIFINTDNKKSDIEKNYYLDRGICVLDCNDLLTNESDYMTKYKEALNAISTFSPRPEIYNKLDVLEFLHSKVAGIGNLEYIKRSDFYKMFSNDFKINNEWKIEHLTYISKTDNLWKDYFDHKGDYNSLDVKKCDQIDAFVKTCNIRGIHSVEGLYFPEVKINNESFKNNYDEIIQYCSLEYGEIKEQFRKAYYLSKTGKLEESYILFTEVLKSSKASKTWDIYYLSQINRYHIYRKIDYARRYYSQPFSVFSMGQIITIDEKFFKELDLEMSHYDIQSQFNKLPYYFKRKYDFLGRFSERNCYFDEINDLMKNKYKIEKSLTTDTMSMGLSKFDKIKLDMLEAVKFIEDNMIYVHGYEESNNYIKNALFIWLRAYDKELNKKGTGAFAHICNTRLKFELQDILLLSKCCKKDDLNYFEQIIKFSTIPFEEVEELKYYVLKIINFYKQKFNGEFLMTEYLWWREICSEMQMLLYISSYYLKNANSTQEIIEFILGCNDGYWSYQDRMSTIQKYITKDNAIGILKTLEKHFIDKLEKYKEKNDTEFSNISLIGRTMYNCAFLCKYEFIDLSNFIITNKDNIQLLTSAIVPLASYLSIDSKNIVLENYELKTVWQLIEKSKIDNTLDIGEYLYLIDDYLENEIAEINIPGMKRYTIPPQEEFIRKISFFIIENNITMNTLSKYKGYWSEFDYFFNVNDFNQEDFDVEWLLYYSDEVLSYIKENETRMSIAKNLLKNMDKSEYKEYTERWLYLYGIFI